MNMIQTELIDWAKNLNIPKEELNISKSNYVIPSIYYGVQGALEKLNALEQRTHISPLDYSQHYTYYLGKLHAFAWII